jgi:regulator of protease activity HflC (stomatin/prohibitin superfamily)
MNGLLLTLILLLVVAGGIGFALRLESRLRETVWAWETGLLYVHGRFAGLLGPGRYWSGIAGREVRKLLAGRQVLIVPAQEVLTADGFPVKLGILAEYRIADARRVQEETGGQWVALLHASAQLALRAPVQARGLDALLADRGAIEAEIVPPLREAAAAIGIEMERVALRDLILPAEVRRMVTEVERARREGEAALERARGEQAALRSLANAARLMKGNPELHALRVLQALAAQPGRPAPTIVLGAGAVLPLAPGGAEAVPPAQD